MSSTPVVTHTLRRTSPKGKGIPFLGTCITCGVESLPVEAALERCPNHRKITKGRALLEVTEYDEEKESAS